MSRFAQFEQLLREAQRMGFEIRYEHLDGNGGGICEFGGKRWLFVDLSLSVEESWELLHDALAQVIANGSSTATASISADRGLRSFRKVG